MSFIDTFIQRLIEVSGQESLAEIRPYLDGYAHLKPEQLSLPYRAFSEELDTLSDNDVKRLVENLCARLQSVEQQKKELYYLIYQSNCLIDQAEMEILSSYLEGNNYYVSIRLLMDEIHKIVHPKTDSKATDEYILDDDEDDITIIKALPSIPSTGSAEETLYERDVASSIQLISPFQVNAFTSYTLHMVVNQQIGFYLPDHIWEVVDGAFENYWDNEVGYGGYFDNDSMFFSINIKLTDSNFMLPNGLLYKIVKSITAFIDSIPGVVIHDE